MQENMNYLQQIKSLTQRHYTTSCGLESIVLTLVEKKTDYYIAIKIHVKDSVPVKTAMEVLRKEYGEDKFSNVFKTITADNRSEFEDLKSIEEWGVQIYFAHPYSSWERAQNERHNRLFRRYVPKGVSIENYTDEQIMWFADEINDLPRRQLCYSTPAEPFDEFLDQVYSVIKVLVA
jgi:integrase, catalytic region